MINSKIVEQVEEVKDYPKLRKHVGLSSHSASEFIVLFTSDKEGTVVWRTSNCKWSLGHYTDDWLPCVFKDFNDTLELHNE